MTVDVEQLSCQELVELVTDYLEGALSAEETARFEDHIGRCAGCAAYLEQIRQTIELTGELDRRPALARGRRRLVGRLPRLALAPIPHGGNPSWAEAVTKSHVSARCFRGRYDMRRLILLPLVGCAGLFARGGPDRPGPRRSAADADAAARCRRSRRRRPRRCRRPRHAATSAAATASAAAAPATAAASAAASAGGSTTASTTWAASGASASRPHPRRPGSLRRLRPRRPQALSGPLRAPRRVPGRRRVRHWPAMFASRERASRHAAPPRGAGR